MFDLILLFLYTSRFDLMFKFLNYFQFFRSNTSLKGTIKEIIFFGRIQAAVPSLSSAGFERPSRIRVRPGSDGRAGSAGFGLTGGFGRIRAESGRM